MSLREFAFIQEIRQLFSGNVPMDVEGIGDDCAVLRGPAGATLVTVDALIEGTHFPTGAPAGKVGQRAFLSALSDIAAMGGIPTAALVALSVPEHWGQERLTEMMSGLGQAARSTGCPVVGGDTCSTAGPLSITVTVLGTMEQERQPVFRRNAQPGDLVVVTGTLGDAALGLEGLLKGAGEASPFLLERFWTPDVRLAEGQLLSRWAGTHAMMDISDGLGQDLGHMCRASGVRAEIYRDRLPLSPETRALLENRPELFLSHVVGGGEDFELLIAVSPGDMDSLASEAERRRLSPLTVIGEFKPGNGVWLLPDNVDIGGLGYRHDAPESGSRP